MEEDFDSFKGKIKKAIKLIGEMIMRVIRIILLPVIIIIIILSAALYYIFVFVDGKGDKDWSGTSYAVSQYTNTSEIDSDGVISTQYTPQEIWDKNSEKGGRTKLYLDNADQLAKLMNAQVVTQFLDTRENPDEKINWDEINKADSKDIQGIIKLKRADSNGNVKTMTYVDPETFQSYIETYNKSGSEEAKNNALNHFTIDQSDGEDDSSDSDDTMGIIQGTGTFTQYNDLTETQIKQIASLCQQEQGTAKGAAAEASLMANRFEMVGKRWGTGGSGLYNYIRNCRWWANAAVFMDKQNASDDVVKAVKAVLVNGKRTLPKYVDEHDYIPDLTKAVNKGQAIDTNSRSEYKQYVTKINNRYGAKYTFYCFPTEGSDPFGYTSKKSRKKYGDAYYDFDTGNLINGSDSVNSQTNEETQTSQSQQELNNEQTANSSDNKGEENGKYYAKVATWSETTDTIESNDPEVESSSNTTYNMTVTNINYQDAVSGYTMPFDYLWALLVIGEDKDFVLQLADLVYGSEIEITVHDNLTVTTDTNIDTYTKKTKTDTEGQVTVTYDEFFSTLRTESGKTDTQKGNWSHENENNYKVTTTNITKDNTLDIALTKANVWIVNYTQDYQYQKPEKNVTSNNEKIDDEEYKKDSESDKDEYGDVNNLLKETVEKHTKNQLLNTDTNTQEVTINPEEAQISTVTGQKIDYIKTQKYKRTINRNIETKNEVDTSKYISSPGKTVEKTDKKSEEDNFVKILLKNECTKARHLILNTKEWLYEILANKDTTKDMVDLTKYLLYKVTGVDYGVTEYDFSEYEPSKFEEVDTGTEGGLSLSTTKFDKATFKKALQEYYNKTKNADFKKNFLDKVDELYDSSISNNVNPELVVITAKAEGNFKETGGMYNYWGIGVPNGASSGSGFSSLSDGIAGYAKTIKKYETGSYAAMIKQKYKERKAAGCNSNGYGMPGTLSGMQSIYSSLGKHEEGSAGAGGYYYMDPDRAGVKTIYSTHQEFLEKCKNKGGEHAEGKPATVWEQGQYTAWQVEKKLEIWKEIFGKYGSVDSTSSDVNIGESKIPSNIRNGTADQKMKYLFPNGIPSNQSKMEKYMTTVKIAMTNKQGKKYEGSIRVHKSLADDVQEVFKSVQDAGFKIYEAGGYCYRYMNNDSVPKKLSYHSYGIAIDINVNENYSHSGGRVYAGSFWNPSKSEYSIPKNGALVKAFKAKGWKWGGNWSGNYQDYMHFSFTGN